MRIILALWLTSLIGACAEQTAPPAFEYFEEEGGRVRDLADILSPEFEARMTEALDEAEADYGYQMAIVTTPSLHGYSIEDFSLFYARAWGLGDAERNDGLLLLVAPNARRVRIEVGKGIENSFTDLYAASVLQEAVIPAFRNSDFEGGIEAGTRMMIEKMREFPTIPANDNVLNIVDRDEAA